MPHDQPPTLSPQEIKLASTSSNVLSDIKATFFGSNNSCCFSILYILHYNQSQSVSKGLIFKIFMKLDHSLCSPRLRGTFMFDKEPREESFDSLTSSDFIFGLLLFCSSLGATRNIAVVKQGLKLTHTLKGYHLYVCSSGSLVLFHAKCLID